MANSTKKYRVIFPNPNGEGKRIYALMKAHYGVIVTRTGRTGFYNNSDQSLLTEEEIKKDFAWAWPLAIEVDEFGRDIYDN